MDRRVLLDARLAELRTAFDESFSQPLVPSATEWCDLLLIGVEQTHYAWRLGELGGLYVDRVVTPLRSPLPALLGLAAFRGKLAPVYDLWALLERTEARPRRWLVLSSDGRLALGFDELTGHTRVPRQALVPVEAGEGLAREVVEHFGRTQHVLVMAQLVDRVAAAMKAFEREV